MGASKDRFPGQREEESLLLKPASSDPVTVGAIALVSGHVRIRDNDGIFDPREGSDEKVRVSSNDTTSGYLNGKLVAGDGIAFDELSDGGNEQLRVRATGDTQDEKVKVSADDTVAGYLEDKVVAGPGIKLATVTPGGDEDFKVSSGKMLACSWGTNATAYIYSYSSGLWNVMARIIFPGTTHMQAGVESIKTVAWVGSASRPMDLRIYDLTNDLVVAETDDIVVESPSLIDFGTISNVPAGNAIWEIQGHKDANPAGFVYMSAMTIFFEV